MTSPRPVDLSVVIPVYFNEGVLSLTMKALKEHVIDLHPELNWEIVFVDGKPMLDGYVALQAETAPIDFRKVEVLNLVGCMDPKASNYKAYYVKSDPTACR